jgi:hypothetical protein
LLSEFRQQRSSARRSQQSLEATDIQSAVSGPIKWRARWMSKAQARHHHQLKVHITHSR